jgi:alginate O-acetyltransferase complex protein AlgI
VFFRAHDLPAAWRYLGDMAGLGARDTGSALLAGIVYQPYYLITFFTAAALVWTAPQTWDWVQSLNARKVLAATALLLLSIAALTTQAYNPFIYFIF